MHKILRISLPFLLVIVSNVVLARDIIIDNQLEDEYVIVTEVQVAGVTSYIPANPLVIAPKTKQPPYVVRLSAEDEYQYEINISVIKDPSQIKNAIRICTASYNKSGDKWLPLKPLTYKCHEDGSIYDPNSGYDLDNMPFTVIIASAVPN